jgi:hypothetical protein
LESNEETGFIAAVFVLAHSFEFAMTGVDVVEGPNAISATMVKAKKTPARIPAIPPQRRKLLSLLTGCTSVDITARFWFELIGGPYFLHEIVISILFEGDYCPGSSGVYD